MKFMLGCCAFILVLFLGVSAYAGGPLALYDNFRAPLINPLKWFGVEWQSSLTMRENLRAIEARRLHLLVRGYGANNADTGSSTANTQLRFTTGNAVTAIKATIKVADYALTGSNTNPESDNSVVQARLYGFFFNTSTPTPGSSENDVIGSVRISRYLGSSDPVDTLSVVARVFQCTDKDCLTVNDLASQPLGTVKVGQQTTVRIEWDKANHRFLAQRDMGPQFALPYKVSDTSLPGTGNNKRLDTQYTVVNSTSMPRPMGFISAFFSNVYVNKSAMPVVMSKVADDAIWLENGVADEADGR